MKGRFEPDGIIIILTPTPKPKVAPSLSAAKVDGLYRGQRLSVINKSDNYTTWGRVTGNWTLVETDGGTRGWGFSPLIRY